MYLESYIKPKADRLRLMRGLSLLSEVSLQSGENAELGIIEDEGEL